MDKVIPHQGSDLDSNHNLNPLIEIKSKANSPFKFNIIFSVTRLPSKQVFQLWSFYPDGKPIGAEQFRSDERGNAIGPDGTNEISVGLSSSAVLPNGNYIFGINVGQFDPPKNSHFNDWYKSQNLKFYTLMNINFNKVTIMTLDDIGNVPWETDIKTSGSLWYKGVPIELESVWPNGGEWFAGRKIQFTSNDKLLKVVDTDVFRFSINFRVMNRPEKGCFLQAHYDGDNNYFDSCDSNIINYKIVRHKTKLSLKIDNLKLSPFNRNGSAEQIDL